MRTIDFSPLHHFTVGFDRMQRQLDENFARMGDQVASYPPYNIEAVGEGAYRITMAVAGFSESDLEIVVQDSVLSVVGTSGQAEEDTRYLHRGIAERSFERRFQLADYIKISGASLENGLLCIELTREVPEEKKPRSIPITGNAPKAISDKAA